MYSAACVVRNTYLVLIRSDWPDLITLWSARAGDSLELSDGFAGESVVALLDCLTACGTMLWCTVTAIYYHVLLYSTLLYDCLVIVTDILRYIVLYTQHYTTLCSLYKTVHTSCQYCQTLTAHSYHVSPLRYVPCHSCMSSPGVGGLLTDRCTSQPLSRPDLQRDTGERTWNVLPASCCCRNWRAHPSPRLGIIALCCIQYACLHPYGGYLIRYIILQLTFWPIQALLTPHMPPSARRLTHDQNTSTSSVGIHASLVFTRETTSQPQPKTPCVAASPQ